MNIPSFDGCLVFSFLALVGCCNSSPLAEGSSSSAVVFTASSVRSFALFCGGEMCELFYPVVETFDFCSMISRLCRCSTKLFATRLSGVRV